MATTRHKKPENWLAAVERKGSGLQQERALGACEQASEALLMGLRLREGIHLAHLAERFGLPEAALLDLREVERHEELELVWRDGPRLGVTPAGMPLLDALLARLVADDLVTA